MQTEQKDAAIFIDNAVKVYQSHKSASPLEALKSLSLSIQPGEFFGLLGPNGAGKSTLINAIAGLHTLNQGEISVFGANVVRDFRQARRSLGIVPQEIVIDPFFTVEQTLQFQSGYFGIRHNDTWIGTLLAELNLTDKAQTNMRQLSGGMKRRVLIAQALVHKPKVLVLDEPTAGVDVELRQTLWRFIRKLHLQGTTIVLTTHYLEEAEQLCDRIAIINHGEIVALDSTDNLLAFGIGKKLDVKTSEDIQTVPECIAEKILHKEARSMQISLTKDDKMMELLDAMRASGMQIDEVSILNGCLEDVFVNLTGGKAS